MKFGTGSNAERTQKYGGSKYKMTYIRPNISINKQTSPIFNCVTPVSVSLATLARQLGNCCVIKPSEAVVASSNLMNELISKYLDRYVL